MRATTMADSQTKAQSQIQCFSSTRVIVCSGYRYQHVIPPALQGYEDVYGGDESRRTYVNQDEVGSNSQTEGPEVFGP